MKIFLFLFTMFFTPLFSSEESVSKGKALYAKYCLSCHGADGRGKTTIGKAMPTMIDLAKSTMTDQQFFDIITKGKPPMPAYNKLKEEERWDMVHYIRTFTPKQPEKS